MIALVVEIILCVKAWRGGWKAAALLPILFSLTVDIGSFVLLPEEGYLVAVLLAHGLSIGALSVMCYKSKAPATPAVAAAGNVTALGK